MTTIDITLDLGTPEGRAAMRAYLNALEQADGYVPPEPKLTWPPAPRFEFTPVVDGEPVTIGATPRSEGLEEAAFDPNTVTVEQVLDAYRDVVEDHLRRKESAPEHVETKAPKPEPDWPALVARVLAGETNKDVAADAGVSGSALNGKVQWAKRGPRKAKTPVICAVPSCGVELDFRNKTGVCRMHNHAEGLCQCPMCSAEPAPEPEPEPVDEEPEEAPEEDDPDFADLPAEPAPTYKPIRGTDPLPPVIAGVAELQAPAKPAKWGDQPWSTQDDIEILELFGEGLKGAAISRETGRRVDHVIARFRHLVPIPGFAAQRDALARLRKALAEEAKA